MIGAITIAGGLQLLQRQESPRTLNSNMFPKYGSRVFSHTAVLCVSSPSEQITYGSEVFPASVAASLIPRMTYTLITTFVPL